MEFGAKAVCCGSDNKGDLKVTLELCASGHRILEIHSKVARLYGEAIRETVLQVLDSFGVENAKVQIDDLGALNFAIRARMETAVKRALAAGGR